MQLDKKTGLPQHRGIYLLPNLFTTGGLFAGFFSIVSAMKGFFDQAAIAIFVAMVADALDGRVARLTNTQSNFGAEYDSLADMVAFGVAPALTIYTLALHSFGKLGWLIAFLYTAAVALRLARFNTQLTIADKRYFQGLACPAGAAIIASVVWLIEEYNLEPNMILSFILLLLALSVAALMVSNIRYHSFKQLDLKGKVPFVAILIIVLVFAAVSIDPPEILFAIFLLYGLSGPVLTLWNLRQKRLQRKLVAHNEQSPSTKVATNQNAFGTGTTSQVTTQPKDPHAS